MLANHVSIIKQITNGIGGQMRDERGLLAQLDSTFLSTKKQVGEIMGRMDDVVGKASNSMFSYVILFTIILVALLWKFS